VGFENVADSKVVEALKDKTALVPCRDLADIVLEPLQASNFTIMEDSSTTSDTD